MRTASLRLKASGPHLHIQRSAANFLRVGPFMDFCQPLHVVITEALDPSTKDPTLRMCNAWHCDAVNFTDSALRKPRIIISRVLPSGFCFVPKTEFVGVHSWEE